MSTSHKQPPLRGGLAQYFVEHREVGWMALVAVLIWGAVSYRMLPQQEDPQIPARTALLVTRFAGASPQKVEELVTQKLEEKIGELDAIEEIKSQSRAGVSVITVKQVPRSKARVDQEWDKLRAKLREAQLPEGCSEPFLNTEFGNTVTLVLGITSPPWSEGQVEAQARRLRQDLAALRGDRSSAGRAAVFALYPAVVDDAHRAMVLQRFVSDARQAGVGRDFTATNGTSFILAEFQTQTNRVGLESFVREFTRSRLGSESDLHPDFSGGLVLWEGEDPAPIIRQAGLSRCSYRELEIAADRLKDALKQVASVGKVQKLGNPQEVAYLLFSIATVNGYRLATDDVIRGIAK